MNVGVLGASGRMGQELVRLLKQSAEMTCVAAVVSAQSTHLGQTRDDLTYQKLTDVKLQPDVWIDFSLPSALAEHLNHAHRHGTPIVVCTTGLTDAEKLKIEHASKELPVLYAANTSIGVNLLQALVELTSAVMNEADIEVFEAHHSAKRDAPSGTALLLGEAAALARGETLADISAGIRGDGLRQPNSIGFSVLRAADIVGEHTVYAAQAGERIELTHRVTDRSVFAKGALRAGQWLATQQAGLYSMRDMLQINQRLGQR